MSLHSLQPKECIYIATNGLRDEALIRAIQTFQPQQIILALDNDEAGQTAVDRWKQRLLALHCKVKIQVPLLKRAGPLILDKNS